MQLISLSHRLFAAVVASIIDSLICIGLIKTLIFESASNIIKGLIKLVSFFISMITNYPLITSNPYSPVITPKYTH